MAVRAHLSARRPCNESMRLMQCSSWCRWSLWLGHGVALVVLRRMLAINQSRPLPPSNEPAPGHRRKLQAAPFSTAAAAYFSHSPSLHSPPRRRPPALFHAMPAHHISVSR